MMRLGKNGNGADDDISDEDSDGKKVISDTQRKTVLVDWNKTDKAFDNTLCIHQLFEQQAQLNPQSIALAFRE